MATSEMMKLTSHQLAKSHQMAKIINELIDRMEMLSR